MECPIKVKVICLYIYTCQQPTGFVENLPDFGEFPDSLGRSRSHRFCLRSPTAPFPVFRNPIQKMGVSTRLIVNNRDRAVETLNLKSLESTGLELMLADICCKPNQWYRTCCLCCQATRLLLFSQSCLRACHIWSLQLFLCNRFHLVPNIL